MATTGRRKDASLIDRLKDRAFEFQFAQAVRVLERAADFTARGDAGPTNGHGSNAAARAAGIGLDVDPHEEIVRFRAHQSLAFPAAEIARLTDRRTPRHAPAAPEPPVQSVGEDDPAGSVTVAPEPSAAAVNAERPAYDMAVTFFGLTGSSGVLPYHYTTMLLKQLRNREEAMRDFLDLFNHRLISLFYRAIEKHDFPLAFERSRRDGASQRGTSNGQAGTSRGAEVDHDALTQILFALIGLGRGDLRRRLSVRDENLLYFSGHFSRAPRSAVALEKIISEYFAVDCRVIQFQGQWLRLDPSDRSMMPSMADPEGRNARMGMSTIMGSAVWDVQSRFRVRLGPLDLDRFIDFTPARPLLRELCELIRLYVGMEYDFDIQPILRREQVPMSRMGGDDDGGARLGWTNWLKSDEAEEDFAGAVFSLEDV